MVIYSRMRGWMLFLIILCVALPSWAEESGLTSDESLLRCGTGMGGALVVSDVKYLGDKVLNAQEDPKKGVLEVRTAFTIDREASSVVGYLTDAGSRLIAWASAHGDYAVGTHEVALRFNVKELAKAGQSDQLGPYHLAFLTISKHTDYDLLWQGCAQDIGKTGTYTIEGIAPALVFTGELDDKARGKDLVISVPVHINVPGEYTVSADLFDESDRRGVNAVDEKMVLEKGDRSIELVFHDVGKYDIWGKYNLWPVEVFKDGERFLADHKYLTKKAYGPEDFLNASLRIS